MESLNSNDLTEKTLATSLSAAVDQHDAEAAKEEISTVGRGVHSRQVRHVVLGISFVKQNLVGVRIFFGDYLAIWMEITACIVFGPLDKMVHVLVTFFLEPLTSLPVSESE